jgi:hypothetical protein
MQYQYNPTMYVPHTPQRPDRRLPNPRIWTYYPWKYNP